MPVGSAGSIHRRWESSPPGAPRNAVNVCPPSTDFHVTTLATYTTSGLEGSTLTSLKSPSRPHRRSSALARRQPSPPSSERYSPPPLVAPTTAYMRAGALCDVARPMRPRPSAAPGRPAPIWRQVVPPSVDRYRPFDADRVHELPISHGACRAAHNTANTVCELAGSNARSTAPVFSSLPNTLCHVSPPSRERYTPRSPVGPYGDPSTAANTRLGSRGSTMTAGIWSPSASPTCRQVAPPSVDL